MSLTGGGSSPVQRSCCRPSSHVAGQPTPGTLGGARPQKAPATRVRSVRCVSPPAPAAAGGRFSTSAQRVGACLTRAYGAWCGRRCGILALATRSAVLPASANRSMRALCQNEGSGLGGGSHGFLKTREVGRRNFTKEVHRQRGRADSGPPEPRACSIQTGGAVGAAACGCGRTRGVRRRILEAERARGGRLTEASPAAVHAPRIAAAATSAAAPHAAAPCSSAAPCAATVSPSRAAFGAAPPQLPQGMRQVRVDRSRKSSEGVAGRFLGKRGRDTWTRRVGRTRRCSRQWVSGTRMTLRMAQGSAA